MAADHAQDLASSGPYLELEYCRLVLPSAEASLPELALPVPLARGLHSYAHGGFMGAALSLLADRTWVNVLLAQSSDTQVSAHVEVLAALGGEGGVAAARDSAALMLVLENSPVLCAYGLARCGCCAR